MRIGILLIMMIVCFNGFAASIPSDNQRPFITDSLRKALSKTNDAADSIRILYDIYDLNERSADIADGWKILDIARRTGNNRVVYDIIRRLSVKYVHNDSVLRLLHDIVKGMPKSTDRDATDVFVDTQRTISLVRYNNSNKVDSLLRTALAYEEASSQTNTFENIRDLYKLCLYLSAESKGDLYLGYVDRLGALINRLPEEAYSLRNQYYTSCANIYTLAGNHEKAVECDRILLDIMEKLDQRYVSEKRVYKNFDINRYIVYRRLLSNYKALKPGEADKYYNAAMEIAARNSYIADDIQNNGRIHAYHFMANGESAKALPLLKKFLASENPDNQLRRQTLPILIEAAEMAGDKPTLYEAQREYTKMMEDYLKLRSEETFRELKIRYDVDELKRQNTDYAIRHQEQMISTRNKIISVVLIGALALAIMLLVIHRFYLKERHRAHGFERENRELKEKNKSLKRINDELSNSMKQHRRNNGRVD